MAKNEVISAVKSMCSLLGFSSGEATYPLRNMQGDGISKLQAELSELGWPFVED